MIGKMTGKEWYAMKGRNNTWTDMAAAAAFAMRIHFFVLIAPIPI